MKNSVDQKIDRLLRHSQKLPKVPEELHTAILRAVRSSRREEPKATPWMPRAFAVAMAVVLLGAAGWMFAQRIMAPAGLDRAALEESQETLAFLGQLSASAPVVLTQPLSNQFDNISKNIQSTTALIVARLENPPLVSDDKKFGHHD